jgi:hypothetical protein
LAVALREALDGSVRGPEEFQRIFGLAPLGVIPLIVTAADKRALGRRRLAVATATTVAVAVVVAAAHYFVVPLDALWFAALRRLGV